MFTLSKIIVSAIIIGIITEVSRSFPTQGGNHCRFTYR
ncbi:hypothetical protein BRLA_c021480 [Brevibacillus laterosporus LMG 15441]|uniref:Uncharacterized protein n=1 Tax=Brevibacillus laterosporus LMG 15441 TaxID=1042163 RepID=A0A075R3M5_BRELA|nr:hypothetical protein BRLA_c021480 [Brevibacillus laterosporus LMG 15441]